MRYNCAILEKERTMDYIALNARQWRERLNELIDRALESGTLLIYLRREQPTFFVIPMPLTSLSEQRFEYTRLLRMFLRVTNSTRIEPSADDPMPDINLNALRRDVNETLTRLKTCGLPFLLKRYRDVIGFVVPIPGGTGGLGMVRTLSAWFLSHDDRDGAPAGLK
jgi:hypothetical protein